MKLSNDLFIQAMNYLITSKKVRDQQHLASVTGITESTLSRIMNDRVQKPSPVTIQKLLQAFPGIFNPLYLQGRSSYLLMSDYNEAVDKKEPDIVPIGANQQQKEAEPTPVSPATDNMLELHAQMIRRVDDLRQELHQELLVIRELKDELRATLQELQRSNNRDYGIAAETLDEH